MSRAAEIAKTVNKLLGESTLILGSDPSLVVEYLPTGILPIDVLLGGGLPRGRFTEIYGDYSTLKSYIGLAAIAQTQAAGGTAALVDTEHAFDPSWATSIGVVVDDLLYQSPPTGELAVDVTEALVRGGVDLVVWDSVAATLPQSERNKREHGEQHQPARLAALMSRATRKITAANQRTALLWINQTRLSVGKTFGNPETVPGGKSLPFYASYRVSLRKAGAIKRDTKQWDGSKSVTVRETVAQKIKATVEKSKLSAPSREVYLTFDMETGQVDEVGYLIAWGLENGEVIREGKSWWIRGGKKKYVGAEKFRQAVETNPRYMKTLRSRCLGNLEPLSNTDESESETS